MKRTIVRAAGSLAVIALVALAFVAPALARQGRMHDGIGSAQGTEITAQQAGDLAAQYLADAGLTTLVVDEVVELDSHFYVAAIDPATGAGALELLVCRHGGIVHPAPTLRWNTTYASQIDWPDMGAYQGMMGGGMMSGGMGSGMMPGGMMSGMMSGGMGQGMMGRAMQHDRMMLHDGSGQCPLGVAPTGEPLAEPLTTAEALAAAQAWLAANDDAATAGSALAFPGYVTVQITRDDTVSGLLAVQTTTGVVWEWGS